MYSVTVPFFPNTDKKKLLAQLKRCGATRVALVVSHMPDYMYSTETVFSSLDEGCRFFKAQGFEVIFWIGETFGHGRGKCDNKRRYSSMRFFDKGNVASYCPTDERFREDLCLWVKRLTSMAPDMIMLDDDYRLDGGCCCENHIKRISDMLGEPFSEIELYQKAFSGGKNRYRDAWLRAQGDSLRDLAKMLRNAVDSVDPSVRLGLCCGPSVWDDDGTDPIELVRLLAGKTKPFLRLIGAPYWTTAGFKMPLGEVIEHERMALSWCRNSGVEVISEGDTYPRPRFTCPASHLECFDTALRADGQANGILKYMFDYVSDPDYETGYVDRMVENIPLYRELHSAFGGKTAVGFRPYSVMHTLEYAHLSEKPSVRFFQEPQLGFAVKNSLPACYEEGNVNILFGEAARHISVDQLKSGNILDIKAAKILTKRGIDVGLVGQKRIADVKMEMGNILSAQVRMVYLKENRLIKLMQDADNVAPIVREGAEVLTKWECNETQWDAIFRYENADGMRFLVYPSDAEAANRNREYFDCYPLRRLLLDNAAWLNGKPMEAYTLGDHPYLYSLVKKDDTSLAIGLWNLFDDKIDRAEIKVNFDYSRVRFVNCEGHIEEGKIVLDSVLYPYEVAAVLLER